MTRRCLIGEADPFIARLLARFGEESGFQSVCVQVGEELLELVRRLRPDFVIVEAELPGEVRGWQAVQSLRDDPDLCHIPVIICSWLSEARARVLAGDVTAYLQKPDLHYDDYLIALDLAGLQAGPRLVPGDGD